MSDVETRHAVALMRLRSRQTLLLTEILPDLTHRDLRTSSSVGRFPLEDGDAAVQRLRVDADEPTFAVDEVQFAVSAVLDPDRDSLVERIDRPDGSVRIDVRTACWVVHSISVTDGGRSLQVTSFSGAVPESEEVDDALVGEETIAAPPEDCRGADPRASDVRDPRLVSLDEEDRRAQDPPGPA